MRKLFYAGIALLCITLVASCNSSGNSNGKSESEQDPLVGKWQMKKEQKESMGTLKLTFDMDLKADKKMACNIDVMVEGAQPGFTMTIPFNLAFDGTWNTTEDKLELKADSATTKASVDKEKIELKFDDPKMEKQGAAFKEMLVASMESNMKSDISKSWVPQEAVAYKIEGNTLKLDTGKDTLVFEKQ